MQESDFIKPSEPTYFPSIFASPEEKLTKQYALQVARSIYWNNFSITQNAYGNNERSRWIDNRNWSNGRFDVTSFIGGKKQRKNNDKNPLLKHLDFDPVTEQPKYRDIIVGYLEELDYEIQATTINPMAKAKKEDKRLREIAILRQKQIGDLQKLNELAGRPIAPESNLPFEAETQQEIDMYFMLGGFKELAELEIELGNEIVQNDSHWKEIKKLLLEDAFDCGRMIVDTEYDKTGRLKYKYVDPVNCGVEDFRGHYLTRPCRIWYIELKTVHEILIDSQGQFTIAQCEEIAKQYENRFGNPVWQNGYEGWQTYVNTDSTYNYFWYNYKIPVMKMYWEELDYYKNSTVKKFGKEITTPADFTEESKVYKNTGGVVDNAEVEKKVSEYCIHNYYQTKWIVNTDYVYDNGKVPFQARDPFDIKFALCPLKYYRIGLQPIGERVKTFAKKIYMTWLKIDNEVANKIPSGYKINVRALENISLGQGEQFTVKHSIELVNETGRLVYADEALADDFGRTIKKDPIEVFDTSTPFLRAIDAWIKLIQFYEDRIMKVTGLNEFMDATNPNPNTPASVAKMAAQGSKHSMSQMASALLTIGEKLAVDASERVRLIVKEQGEYNGYAESLGDGMTTYAKVTDAVVPHKFGIKIVAKPTAQEREALNAAILQAFANMASPEQGGLYLSSVLKFQSMNRAGVNMKLIRLMMDAEQRQMIKRLNDQKKQAIQEQGKINSQNTKDAAAGELETYRGKKAIDLQYEQMFTAEVIKRLDAEVAIMTDAKRGDQSHKSNLKINEEVVKQTIGA